MEIDQVTSEIIGAAIKVHRTLGPGLLESVYRICLAHEVQKRGLAVVQEKPIPLIYDGVRLDCGFRADLIVESKVIVECKAKETLHDVDKAQVISHLRLLDLPVGLLINFNVVELRKGIKRLFKNKAPEINVLPGD